MKRFVDIYELCCSGGGECCWAQRHDGYRIEFRGGKLPHGCQVPAKAFRAMQLRTIGAVIPIYWIDEAKDTQEAFAFQVVVIRVDPAGNESEPSSVIRIVDKGRIGEPDHRIELEIYEFGD